MALREVLADLVVRVRGTQQLGQAQRSVGGAVGSLRTAGRALAGVAAAVSSALAVREVAEYVDHVADAAAETGLLAQQLGLSSTALQEWQHAARLAGRDGEDLVDLMSTLQERARDALLDPGSDPAEQMRRLGVGVRDAGGELRTGEALLLDVADALAGMTSETDRVGAAMTLFGDEGRRMLPVLRQGSVGLEELRAEARALGGGFSEDAVAGALEYRQQMARLDLAMTGFKSQLATSVLPALARMVSTVAEWTAATREVLERSNAAKVALGALAVAASALALALAPVLLLTLALLAPWALLFLVVEDLVTLFNGGRSVIGDFLDELFGAGSAQTVVESLTAAWETFVEVLREAGELLGIIDEAGPSPESPVVRARRRRLGKAESAADGAEARGQGRRRRAVSAERGAAAPPWLAALRGGGAEPTRAVPMSAFGRGDTNVEQRVDVQVPITVQGASDPEATARAVERRASSGLARAIEQAAARTPQGAG